MKTVFSYSEKNILVIPQSLYAMSDVLPLLNRANASFFYKSLEDDLLDVEFYTNTPCLVYIKSGQETITAANNHSYELAANSAIFLPQGLNLHSDYVKTTTNLKAYLVFFNDQVISSYLSTLKQTSDSENTETSLLPIKCDDLIKTYFNSIQQLSTHGDHSTALINIKLLELLHLLSMYHGDFNQTLSRSNQASNLPKRNIMRLLSKPDSLKLSINDLANLSGKSVSTFNRDFKLLYNMPPKKWLLEKKLMHAHQLLSETDLSVTHIAAELGYENVSHFIKFFKQKYKVTPKQFKLSH